MIQENQGHVLERSKLSLCANLLIFGNEISVGWTLGNCGSVVEISKLQVMRCRLDLYVNTLKLYLIALKVTKYNVLA